MASRLIPSSWLRWTSGAEMRPQDVAGMRRLMRKTRFRVPGESQRERFVRFRAVIEASAAHRERMT